MEWFQNVIQRVIAFLPDLAAGLIILLFGYIVARIGAAVTLRVLQRVGLDRRLARWGLVRADATEPQAPAWTASAVFWVVMLIALTQAARAWGLHTIAAGLSTVLAFLPHVLAAVLILALAIALGNWVRDRMVLSGDVVLEATSERRLVGAAVRAGIIAIGAFMALRELQIAEPIVTIAFAVTIGAIGVAVALAFGLGSRGTAERLTNDWYERRRAGNGGTTVLRTPEEPLRRPDSPRP
jgi:hypothetical protein